jgi:hypothetical protein
MSVGNLVIERIGDGSTTLSNAAAPIAVLEITTTGSLAQTVISFPSSGSDQQNDSGSSTSNGCLNFYNPDPSTQTQQLSVPGYNSAAGVTSVASTNTKVNSILGMSGTVVTRTLFPTGGPSGTPPSPFSGNNFRSSIATSGSTFYSVGTSSGSPVTGGAWYFNGTAFTQVSSTASGQTTNMRNVEIYNNQLYTSSASSGTGVWAIGSGLPTAAGQTSTLVINTGAGPGTSASPYGFVMFSTGSQGAGVLDLAYIADDRSAVGGGLQKWTFNGSAWNNSWALLVGASGTSTLQSGAGAGFAGLRGLTGSWDAVNGARLYATTTETSNNRLISILDAGATPSTYTTLQAAGSNFVFRGVDLVPVPEPSSLAALGSAAALAVMLGRRRACR